MAIRLDLIEKNRNLFCESKFWGDPDMAPDMEYPMLGGRPLTFLCQVDCYDIAPLDPDGILPHDGMLYFFADIDDLLGYETGISHGPGEWPKGHALVKYTKAVNMETFKSVVQVDEDDEPLSQKAVALLGLRRLLRRPAHARRRPGGIRHIAAGPAGPAAHAPFRDQGLRPRLRQLEKGQAGDGGLTI